jgi:hypothetical protein
VSTINSPIVTKSQPLQTSLPITADPITDTAPIPVPSATAIPTDQPTAPDPLDQIMNFMTTEFGKISNRLVKLEAFNNNDYNNWDTHPTQTWEVTAARDKGKLADHEDQYANLDYDNHEFYDDLPNDATYMAIANNAMIETNHPDTILTASYYRDL